jgi:hypothetical protein
VGADAGLPDELRFVLGVIQLVRERDRELAVTNELDGGELSPAVFFFAPTLQDSVESKVQPMLNMGRIPLGGKFWLLGPTSNFGREIPLESWEDDEAVFAFATELNLHELPAIVLETRTEEIRLRRFPNGLKDLEHVEEVPLQIDELTIKEVFERIDEIHRSTLRIPQGPKEFRLWEKPSQHWPVERVEEKIQEILRIGLQSALYSAFVKVEQPQPSGRIDLVIEERVAPSTFVRHALLELKALRSYGSTGKSVSQRMNEEWVAEGVDQVASYRNESESRAAALVCFDLRDGNTGEQCFRKVKQKAESLKIELGVWHIYASAKDARKA